VDNGHFGYIKNLKKQKKILEWWWFAGSTDSGTNSLQKAKCSTNAKNILCIQFSTMVES
jgi:hypothetical protein